MPRTLASFFILILIFPWTESFAADPATGPVVEDYGPVLPVAAGAFNLESDRHYKVSKDVSASDDDYRKLNRGFESVARLLNMQARSGTPMSQFDMAVVVHGMAAKDLLTDAAYQSRFGMSNPNTDLLAALEKAGVAI